MSTHGFFCSVDGANRVSRSWAGLPYGVELTIVHLGYNLRSLEANVQSIGHRGICRAVEGSLRRDWRRSSAGRSRSSMWDLERSSEEPNA